MKLRYFLLVILSLALGAGILRFAHAQTATDLQSKIAETQTNIASLNAEIAQYQSQLATLGTQKNSLANTVSELTLTSKKLAADIKVTQQKINAALLQKKQLSDSITTTSASITADEHTIAALLKETYEGDSSDLITLLAQPGISLGDFWREVDAIETIQSSLSKTTKDLYDSKTALETHKQAVEANEKDLETLAAQLNNQKKVNDTTIKEKNSLLAQTKNSEANYTKLLKDRQAKEAALEADTRNYEAQLKFVLNPGSIPPSGTAVFTWPTDKIVITQLFGKTGSSGRLYASGTHNGVDFGMPTGTPVHPVSTGTVAGSGNTDLTCPGASWGNWILIKYDDGLATVYGHLSLVAAKTGQRVTPGDVVAYSGSTGYATGPHLHVSVYASAAVQIKTLPSQACAGKVYTEPIAAINGYLDPMLYFPIPTKAMLQYAS